jgi:hypothetical protein
MLSEQVGNHEWEVRHGIVVLVRARDGTVEDLDTGVSTKTSVRNTSSVTLAIIPLPTSGSVSL